MSSGEQTAHAYFWVSGIIGLVAAIVYAAVTFYRDRKRREACREECRARRRK